MLITVFLLHHHRIHQVAYHVCLLQRSGSHTFVYQICGAALLKSRIFKLLLLLKKYPQIVMDHVGRQSINRQSADHRLTIDWLLTNCRLRVGEQLVDCQSAVNWLLVDNSYWSSVNCHLTVSWPMVYQLSVVCQLMVGQQLVDSRWSS